MATAAGTLSRTGPGCNLALDRRDYITRSARNSRNRSGEIRARQGFCRSLVIQRRRPHSGLVLYSFFAGFLMRDL